MRTRETAHGSGHKALLSFYPDYTVGLGVSPNLLTLTLVTRQALAGYTAGGDLHPALRTDVT